jgi:hypothetical protein
MAKALCIPKAEADKIIKALQSGDLSIESLYNMNSSAERQAAWAKHTGPELAALINPQWEAAAANTTRGAMTKLMTELAGLSKGKAKPKTKTILDKVKALDDAGLLDADTQEATFTDLIMTRLGVNVTGEELGFITKKAKEIEGLQVEAAKAEAKGIKEGGQTKEAAEKWREELQPKIIAWKKSLQEMDKFLNSRAPVHTLAVLTGSIGRGNMLTSVSVGTVNSISNSVQGLFKAIERRMVLRQIKGSNTPFAVEYVKMAMSVFNQTGFDISREYAEDMRLGEKLTHNEGPSITEAKGVRQKGAAATRAVAREQAKLVFKYILGYSDVIFAAAARADYANIGATKIAKMRKGFTDAQNEAYALQVFKESVKTTGVDIITQQGEDATLISVEAISEAESATWTDKRFMAEKAMGLRDWINGVTGDLQLGFWTIPFVKTGTNVVQFGLEASPLGAIPAFANFVKFHKATKDPTSTETDLREASQDMWRSISRAGLGTLMAGILVGMIDPDDFLSAYDSLTKKERELRGLKKGVYNAVKIGETWISLDFFGPLAPAIVGMLYAKKYGDGPVDTAFKFAQGAGQQTLQVPGMDSFEDLIESWRELLTADTLADGTKAISVSTINTIRSRAIPGIFGSVAKGLDTKDRQIDRGKWLDGIKANLPLLRETLPAKIDVTTGEEVGGAGRTALGNLFFNIVSGSRVKRANVSDLIDEISRLDDAGHSPTITRWDSSSKVRGLKTQVSIDKFQDALKWVGREYGRRATRLLKTAKYKRASDEDKRDLLNEVRTDVRSMMLRKFGYRKPRSKGRQVRK